MKVPMMQTYLSVTGTFTEQTKRSSKMVDYTRVTLYNK
jgi:hypothetical protein